MRAALILAAVGASAASLDSPFLFSRQAGIAGCEDQCNPVMDWALVCRTDINKCMETCDAELLATSDKCVECMQATNPEEAVKIQARVDPIRQMCGGEAAASPSPSAPASETSSDPAAAPSSGAASPSASASAPSESAAASGSAPASASAPATASGSAAAPSGSAVSSGSASASRSVSGSAAASASTPATTSGSGAGKVSLSFGAVAAAVAAYLL
ncbi:hypothetical protein CcaverHIS002_0208950 [Cutaneotrichosporon cavernicola]|uniref:Extracellular membrane protein CFEM domain-containing protein n=1 Tax=Cutaneotrichosporon cavernicola TaxID=279322 RepID=A0AA48I4K7_9TREE|nr:uncharacterized protein CcaverHIS019_0208960 [Cutaneotrichosporon cavernicola]BEI81735.1 hypothetical protein CcaverHIS002_0208950 [Cutaneotrichosporon cavernicola]BEI89534.1 hypothetical protein CcaverHIS019_0208960 [Cutaneotrichosporon cavernicola]BEI97307.1 hypothetical protein CcaverHIS631_0208960 [Cutaneotrichosporon cavernicola]BEJ05081.1 hypothetical protein CcaverHIS641_0208980 [Cutaneotrichosporon cavernicola]